MAKKYRKKYGVVLADPPWEYTGHQRRGSAENHYGTLSTKNMIKMFDVASIVKDDAILLMWATWPKLLENPGPRELIEAWGFRPVTGMPWIKVSSVSRGLFDGKLWIEPKWGTGYWVRGASECLIIARRGKPPMPENPPIGLLCDRAIHSKKPNDAHEYAELFPGPYLEMFARRPREGWDVFGNQVEDSITL